MPTPFTFEASAFDEANYLPLSALTRGTGAGVNNPSQFSAIANGTIGFRGDVDVFAITLVAGQTYTFDIDGGFGDAQGGSVDLEIDLISFAGSLVLSDDDSAARDVGSASTRDPLLAVRANVTGTYFIAVHSQNDEYRDDEFSFATPGGGVGDYSLVVSSGSLPPPARLNNADNSIALGDVRNNVQALGGNDRLILAGGDDLANGGTGNDTLFGGAGDDELAGAPGFDLLYGGAGDDALIGGGAVDRLYGGDEADALSGGIGNDLLAGDAGNDRLWGQAGNDNLFGGRGNDFLRGGAGADTLFGGLGADTFHFLRGESPFDAAPPITIEDRIRDFSTLDTLDLSDLLAGTVELAFRGAGAFTGAGQVRVLDLRSASGSGNQEVQINLDGNRATIELAFLVDTSGDFTLGRSDFEL